MFGGIPSPKDFSIVSQSPNRTFTGAGAAHGSASQQWRKDRIPRRRHRHPRDDPREDVGEDVGVGVVECGLNPTDGMQQ